MPTHGSDEYKNAVFDQLSKGSSSDEGDEDHFQHFDHMSKTAPRQHLEEGFGDAFHPERMDSADAEPQFRSAASKMEPNERSEIAQGILKGLQQRGLAPTWLQRLLGLDSTDPSNASADDVAKLTEYSRQNHPEVFKQVMADKPFLVRWLDKPVVAALVGVIAGKLLNRQYDK